MRAFRMGVARRMITMAAIARAATRVSMTIATTVHTLLRRFDAPGESEACWLSPGILCLPGYKRTGGNVTAQKPWYEIARSLGDRNRVRQRERDFHISLHFNRYSVHRGGPKAPSPDRFQCGLGQQRRASPHGRLLHRAVPGQRGHPRQPYLRCRSSLQSKDMRRSLLSSSLGMTVR